jgi:hypothetical protein
MSGHKSGKYDDPGDSDASRQPAKLVPELFAEGRERRVVHAFSLIVTPWGYFKIAVFEKNGNKL